jgi:L-lactate utilization protein LutB
MQRYDSTDILERLTELSDIYIRICNIYICCIFAAADGAPRAFWYRVLSAYYYIYVAPYGSPRTFWYIVGAYTEYIENCCICNTCIVCRKKCALHPTCVRILLPIKRPHSATYYVCVLKAHGATKPLKGRAAKMRKSKPEKPRVSTAGTVFTGTKVLAYWYKSTNNCQSPASRLQVLSLLVQKYLLTAALLVQKYTY